MVRRDLGSVDVVVTATVTVFRTKEGGQDREGMLRFHHPE
jgi:hypothetical protein